MNQHRPILDLIRAVGPALDALPPGGIDLRSAHLSQAWTVVNALGAPPTVLGTERERDYNQGISDALDAIEAIGGCDPADLLRRFIDARRQA